MSPTRCSSILHTVTLALGWAASTSSTLPGRVSSLKRSRLVLLGRLLVPRARAAKDIPLFAEPPPSLLGVDWLADALREPLGRLRSRPHSAVRRRLRHHFVQVGDDFRSQWGNHPGVVSAPVSESLRSLLVVSADQRSNPWAAQGGDRRRLRYAEPPHHQQNDLPVATLSGVRCGAVAKLHFFDGQVGNDGHRRRHGNSRIPADHPSRFTPQALAPLPRPVLDRPLRSGITPSWRRRLWSCLA